MLTVSNVSYQANLLKKCPDILPKLEGETGAFAAETLLTMANLYGDCAARHNQLVTEIKQRETQL
ncbi:TPA: hypothetical protein QIS90_001274 [Providencia rettgeri]|nr:hypothetical protein [Providencia rettgeri]